VHTAALKECQDKYQAGLEAEKTELARLLAEAIAIADDPLAGVIVVFFLYLLFHTDAKADLATCESNAHMAFFKAQNQIG
jgi:hypothetical protein